MWSVLGLLLGGVYLSIVLCFLLVLTWVGGVLKFLHQAWTDWKCLFFLKGVLGSVLCDGVCGVALL